jgi:hypothetical protein
MMRPRLASVLSPALKLCAPSICMTAWVRFLWDQGATVDEIGSALSISPARARRLLRRSHTRERDPMLAKSC